ncbi:MAG: NfeD family protein [Acidimicrobiia bacterium]
MDFDSPDTWRWIWLGVAFFFTAGEILAAGTFFFLPFGIGGVAACVSAFAGNSVLTTWIVFTVTSVVFLAALVPLGRRLDRSTPGDGDPIGAGRWVGRLAVVLEDIPAGPSTSGMARVDREEWRAASADDRPIPAGATVRVVKVDGTRVIVERADDTPAEENPTGSAPPA